ncbi:MAG: sigma-E factor negative regulatory protein [Aromatoleum sp.]|nr:sigma-E factor negative regulatory protein [Aromatoleum sp.]
MGEEISRLMDGELDDEHVEIVCGQLKHPEGMSAWMCYHVIGDTLRGTDRCTPGFSRRFSARLAAEPTVLAPRTRQGRTASFAWAAAATVAAVAVVGWVAVGTLDVQPTVMAKAREAGSVRSALVGPQAVPADYLIAHQEYSPTAQIQGVGPYLRAAAAQGPDGRP